MKNWLQSLTTITLTLALAHVCYPVIEEEKSEKIEKKRKPESVYLFHQQEKDVCFLAPLYNLTQLEKLLKKYPKAFDEENLELIPDYEWANRRLWFGREYEHAVIWNNAFKSMISDEYPDLKKFIITGIEKAPLLPYLYNEKGEFLFKDKESIFSFSGIQYFFMEAKHLQEYKEPVYEAEFFGGLEKEVSMVPNLSMMVPFYRNYDGQYYGYINDIDSFENMYYYDEKGTPHNYNAEAGYHASNNGEFVKLSSKLPVDEQYNYTINIFDYKTKPNLKKLKPKTVEIPGKRDFLNILMLKDTLFGMPEVALDTESPQMSIEYDSKYYASYRQGLYKIMLLRLGLDENNNDIFSDKEHRLYTVANDLKKVFNKDKERDFWSDDYFSKDMLLEYHLTQLFKNDKKLYKKAQDAVDFYLEGWKTYNNFIDLVKNKKVFRDSEGKTPYTEDVVTDYFAGPEQMLAYHVMFMIRLLWYGALNQNAFYETTIMPGDEINNVASECKKPEWSFDNFKKEAYEKKFINTWQKIIKALTSDNSIKREHFISFNGGHGLIISFSQTLIDLQNEKAKENKCDLELLNDLGIAGIESWHSSDLPTFYKKSGK